MMVAWVGIDNCENGTVVYGADAADAWAEYIQATGNACEVWDGDKGTGCTPADCQCVDARVERAPEFDAYEPKDPPLEAFQEAGWLWHCADCPSGTDATGDWRVVDGRGLCTECADIAEGETE